MQQVLNNKSDVSDSLIVEVSNLYKTFKDADVPALCNISLSLKKGELTSLVGPDGAGKTTFLRMLSGLLIPNSGRVLIDGFSPLQNMNEVKSIIGYMPQKFGLYEDLSVIENLNLYVALNDGDKAKIPLVFYVPNGIMIF